MSASAECIATRLGDPETLLMPPPAYATDDEAKTLQVRQSPDPDPFRQGITAYEGPIIASEKVLLIAFKTQAFEGFEMPG